MPGSIFSQYDLLEDVSATASKADIGTREYYFDAEQVYGDHQRSDVPWKKHSGYCGRSPPPLLILWSHWALGHLPGQNVSEKRRVDVDLLDCLMFHRLHYAYS